MINFTIYLIEDHLGFQRKIHQALAKELEETFGFVEFDIISVENVITFYSTIEQQIFSSTTIFIIDIDLNTYFDGIMVGKKIRQHNSDSKIMYLTSFENKAVDIINENIFPEGYILKSQNIENIIIQVISNFQKIISNYTTENMTLLINSGYQNHIISYNEILYITILPGMRNSLLLKSSSKEILFSGTLSKMKNELVSPPFILNLKSYIINFDAISFMNKSDGTIFFKNQEELYIGKQGIKKIEQFKRGN